MMLNLVDRKLVIAATILSRRPLGHHERTVNEDLSSLREPGTGNPLQRSGQQLAAAAGSTYPIVNGIPRFVPAENYASDFGRQWQMFPATQLDSHSGLPITEERLARCLGGDLTQLAGRRVLEAGSGAGRFTEILLKYGAHLDSFDYSSAVEANARNNGATPFTLVQADIRAIPFQPNSYDFVICLGVLQHTPNTEESIAKLWEMVRPQGRLIIDHYRWNLWLRLPPPFGNAEKLYRRIVLALPSERRWPAVKKIVDFWFPLYWYFRDNRWAQRILARFGGLHFYYAALPLRSRQQTYEWSLLDSHDGMTDRFKRFRTVRSIRQALQRLGAEDIEVRRGGNGLEASCRKPAR
jgi:SAM-dependent methyltransferase